jgi:monooxygenase
VHALPRQGVHKPWIYHQNYARDLAAFRFGKLEDGAMKFERRRTPGGTRSRESQPSSRASAGL